ncbi:hypothetical protein MW887_004384 [Aspergillus wentii]|nr:hypothetical protein MW887_004384 [Aspergillus wentii]
MRSDCEPVAAPPPVYSKHDYNVDTKGPLAIQLPVDLEPGHLSTRPSPTFNKNAASAPPRGQRRYYFPTTRWTRAFAFTVIIETILTVGIESWILIDISKGRDDQQKEDTTRRLRSFLGLYIFALLYELLLSYDALRRQNTIQLVGLCICNGGLLTYGFLQMREIKATLNSVITDQTVANHVWATYKIELILVPVFLAVGTVLMSFLTWKLRAEFSWSIYKNISADIQMKRRYITYQVYIALLKFDFFFIFGSQLQILLVIIEADSNDFIINAAMIPVTIVTLLLAGHFCRKEKAKSLLCIMAFMLVLMACFIMMLIQIHSPQGSDVFSMVRVSLTLFSVIVVLLLGVTLINTVMCINNFHKGLKPHINNSTPGISADASLELKSREGDTRFLLN